MIPGAITIIDGEVSGNQAQGGSGRCAAARGCTAHRPRPAAPALFVRPRPPSAPARAAASTCSKAPLTRPIPAASRTTSRRAARGGNRHCPAAPARLGGNAQGGGHLQRRRHLRTRATTTTTGHPPRPWCLADRDGHQRDLPGRPGAVGRSGRLRGDGSGQTAVREGPAPAPPPTTPPTRRSTSRAPSSRSTSPAGAMAARAAHPASAARAATDSAGPSTTPVRSPAITGPCRAGRWRSPTRWSRSTSPRAAMRVAEAAPPARGSAAGSTWPPAAPPR